MNNKYVHIGLVSMTILSTELLWTRIFSAEFYYTFAFLILSLAILGLGLGALSQRLFPRLGGTILLPVWMTCTGLTIVAAVPIIFSLGLDFSKLITEPVQMLKLIFTVVLLSQGFFFGGMSVASILKTNSNSIPRLYTADFFGASAGVIAFFIVMNFLGAPATLLFCALPVLLAAFLAAHGWMRVLPAAAAVLIVAYITIIGRLPEQKREERAPVIYTHWDATAKIKVYEYDSTARGINIDNIANTPVHRFDGNWNVPDSQKVQFDIDVRNLITKFPQCRFLSLGSGGGSDVLQALQYNAAEIHAVEVIPHINELMTRGFLKEFSGNIYHDPRVQVVTEDARAYIRRHEKKFDVIYSLSSNSWAAFASGSFALAENYLFTTEAFMDYWWALSDSGYLSIEHQFYAPRLAAEAMDALKRLNVQNPESHIAIYDLTALRRKLLLISKQPLTEDVVTSAYANSNPQIVQTTKRLYPLKDSTVTNLYRTIIESGWRTAADTAKIDISPCTDNRPFIAQLGLLRNIDPSKLDKIPLYEFTGFPLSKVIVLIILAVGIVVIIPLNLLPYFFKGEKLRALPWLYFFAIGIGYMMIEVVLIQQYTLFIGSSIYSIALVLTVLLVASGIGSGHSNRFSHMVFFAGIILWLLADILIVTQFFYLFEKWPLIPRMIFSAFLIAPAGYFMGMPFPKAASKVAGHVDWAFAVNASAAVIGSVIAVIIASSLGYSIVLLTALSVYGCAFGLYTLGIQKSD